MSHQIFDVTEIANDDQKLEQKVMELVRKDFQPYFTIPDLSHI